MVAYAKRWDYKVKEVEIEYSIKHKNDFHINPQLPILREHYLPQRIIITVNTQM